MHAHEESSKMPRVLVVGAYGLIGYGITKKLIQSGYRITGIGRNRETAQRVIPDIDWFIHDVAEMIQPDQWMPLINDVSAVINCSGALQDSPSDDLEAIHHHAVKALAEACAITGVHLVQISAVGAKTDASTAFLASKARGDEEIIMSGAAYCIFRPALVLGAYAYGGSAMLRMLAAFPLVQPLASPNAKIQTISLEDLALAVEAAITGSIPAGFVGDLAEAEPHKLRDIVSKIRQWLGFKPARYEFVLPKVMVSAISKTSDILGYFGWRSPLRSTAISVLANGVQGEPADLRQFGLTQTSSLSQTLRGMPISVQDRLFARIALLMPVTVACLCFFWLVSGIIGLLRLDEAAAILQNAGWASGIARTSVTFWALVDITIGAAFIFRKFAKSACLAAVAVSIFYLLASTLTVPALWLNPLGPLVKIMPGIVLAMIAYAALDNR